MPLPFYSDVTDSVGRVRTYWTMEGIKIAPNGVEVWKTDSSGAISGTFSFASGTVLKIDNGTAAAPSLTDSTGTSGWFRQAAGIWSYSGAGTEMFRLGSNVLDLGTNGLRWGSALGTNDIFFRRSAAKTLTVDTDGAGGALTLINLASPTTINGFTFTAVDANNLKLYNNSGITALSVFGDSTKSVWLRHDGSDGFVQTNGGTTSLKVSGDGGSHYLVFDGTKMAGTLPLRQADGSVTAPSFAFTSGTNHGMYMAAGTNGPVLAANGVDGLRISAAPSVDMRSDCLIRWSSDTTITSTPDVILSRFAAGTLRLANSTNAQTFQWFGTTAPGTNTQWGEVYNDGTSVGLRPNQSGSTTALALKLGGNTHDTVPDVTIRSGQIVEINSSGGTSQWRMTNGKNVLYNTITTVGNGHPGIYGYGDTVAATNTGTASIATYTPAADGTFEVSANCLVTTATAHSFSLDVTYTDESNVARTLTLPIVLAGTGAFVTNGLITNVTGVGAYEAITMTIRAKASNAITVRTSAGGTFTTVVYNARGTIKQIG